MDLLVYTFAVTIVAHINTHARTQRDPDTITFNAGPCLFRERERGRDFFFFFFLGGVN